MTCNSYDKNAKYMVMFVQYRHSSAVSLQISGNLRSYTQTKRSGFFTVFKNRRTSIRMVWIHNLRSRGSRKLDMN